MIKLLRVNFQLHYIYRKHWEYLAIDWSRTFMNWVSLIFIFFSLLLFVSVCGKRTKQIVHLTWTFNISLISKFVFCHKFIETNENNWNDENGCTIQCICDHFSQCDKNASKNSFACKQCAIPNDITTKYCIFFVSLLILYSLFLSLFVVILLTVFMLSLDCLVHSKKYLRRFCCASRVFVYSLASIDAYKMILFQTRWAFNSTVGLKFNFRLSKAFEWYFFLQLLLPNALKCCATKKSTGIFSKAFFKQKDQKTEKKNIIRAITLGGYCKALQRYIHVTKL